MGSKDGRTVLMNPQMVAAAAVHGEVTDVRDVETTPVEEVTRL
jgi:3-isopropylmalate/(R)-2-methylmalate dehydratase large subunit